MFKDAWHVISRFLFVAGIALTFLVFVELFRAFIFFYRVSPAWGWGFTALLAGGALTALLYLRSALSAYPKVLVPPPLHELSEAGHQEMRSYVLYLRAYLGRLGENPHLDETQLAAVLAQQELIDETLAAHPLNDDLRRLIVETEEKVVRPVLGILDELASKEVRRSVRDVMLGVTLSPYHSVDLVIVLYRNAAMVLRIAGTYASRPNTREQFLILRDVLRVVVTVNFLYIGRNLLENLFANIPLIGRVVDDIGQGLGAGLFTSASGHAAIDRCAAFRGWDKQEAADSLASRTRTFLTDVRDIFTRDVLPDLRNRIRSELPNAEADQPAFWDTLAGGIGTAVDKTAGVVDSLVIQPAMAGTRGVVSAGSAMFSRRAPGGEPETSPHRSPSRRKRRRRHPKSHPLSALAQRIRYGLWRR